MANESPCCAGGLISLSLPSAEWPSLVDELELADTLFGHRGQALVASWLEGETARIDDMGFARQFSDHIELPGVRAEDYLHRRIRTSSGNLLGGIRFYGRDITRPFVEIVAHSFDDLDRLCDCVSREWSMFAPPLLRLRARPGRISGPNVLLDESVYVARYRDMRPPSPDVWLEPFSRVEDAESVVTARYQRMAADDPALARNVFPAATAELAAWHESGQLVGIRTRNALVGLLAVAPGAIWWIDGDEINEEVIAIEHRGHGYAALAQAAWAAHAARDRSRLLIGTIDRLNTASRKTAEAAGRRRVLDVVFLSLMNGHGDNALAARTAFVEPAARRAGEGEDDEGNGKDHRDQNAQRFGDR